mgnify:CR=1 FL=1
MSESLAAAEARIEVLEAQLKEETDRSDGLVEQVTKLNVQLAEEVRRASSQAEKPASVADDASVTARLETELQQLRKRCVKGGGGGGGGGGLVQLAR